MFLETRDLNRGMIFVSLSNLGTGFWVVSEKSSMVHLFAELGFYSAVSWVLVIFLFACLVRAKLKIPPNDLLRTWCVWLLREFWKMKNGKIHFCFLWFSHYVHTPCIEKIST